MSGPRFFIGKHPCDDQPYIHDVDPDPRSGDSHFTFDGPDYSGWYVKQEISDEMIERAAESIYESEGGREWAGETILRKQIWRDIAKAALTAVLRNPGSSDGVPS